MISEALGGMWTSLNVDPEFKPLEQFVAQAKLEDNFDSLDYSPENLVLEMEEVST